MPQYDQLITPCYYIKTLSGDYHNGPDWTNRIFIIPEGARTVLRSSDREMIIDTPSVVFTSSDLPVSVIIDKDGISRKTMVLYFSDSIFPDYLRQASHFSDAAALFEMSQAGLICGSDTAKKVIDLLEMAESDNGLDSFIVLLQLLKLMSDDNDKGLLSDKGYVLKRDNSSKRLDRCLRFLETNYNKHISLDDLAGVACMTRESTCRFLRKQMNESFSEIIQKIRIRNAGFMLIHSDKTIASIASDCGFENISYFNRIFKKKTNMSPSAFRNAYHARFSMEPTLAAYKYNRPFSR